MQIFPRTPTFRELSLGENFSSAKDSSPRALISGRGSSRTCAYLLRDFRATGTDILEGSTPPCAEMLPDFSWPERTLSAGRGLPSVLAVNPGSTGPTPLLSCSTWWTAPRRPPGPTAMPRHPTSTARYHLPSLPGSPGVSCASGRRSVIPTTLPSGSSPRLSATRATLSRAS
jgi:hypothetical protein